MDRNRNRVLFYDPDGALLSYIAEREAELRVANGNAMWLTGTHYGGQRRARLVGHFNGAPSRPALSVADSERAAGLRGPISEYHRRRIERWPSGVPNSF